jgi:hypothetical protein
VPDELWRLLKRRLRPRSCGETRRVRASNPVFQCGERPFGRPTRFQPSVLFLLRGAAGASVFCALFVRLFFGLFRLAPTNAVEARVHGFRRKDCSQ